MRKLVIIPTYNERENIAAMIETVMALPGEWYAATNNATPSGCTSCAVRGSWGLQRPT